MVRKGGAEGSGVSPTIVPAATRSQTNIAMTGICNSPDQDMILLLSRYDGRLILLSFSQW